MKKLIKPRSGVQVRKPDGGVLSPDGELLEYGSWWIRREREGDITASKASSTARNTPVVTDTKTAKGKTDAAG